MRVVLDDEQHRVAFRDLLAVVRDLLLGSSRASSTGIGLRVLQPLRLLARQLRVRQRQVQRERAARAGLAGEADLAAEQVRELARDCEAEAGAAVLAARACIRLLERLEDQLLLLRRDADAGVGHGERDREVARGSRLG